MNRNVLITGGSNGIGLEMARALAADGDHVVIASRDQTKAAAAVAQITRKNPAAKIEFWPLDLGDFGDVDRFIAKARAQMPVIDVLILNAGLYTLKLSKLPNGFESMFGIMHLGHFRLATGLLDALKAAPQGRIVVTSSMLHAISGIDEASFTDPSRHRFSMSAYGQAKLANLLFTRELARRLSGTPVTINAFHPGAVATGIYDGMPAKGLMTAFMLTPAQGADTGIWLATAPELLHTSGEYFVKRKLKPGSSKSRSVELAQRLWTLSEKLALPAAA